jgi:hypothetical protein
MAKSPVITDIRLGYAVGRQYGIMREHSWLELDLTDGASLPKQVTDALQRFDLRTIYLSEEDGSYVVKASDRDRSATISTVSQTGQPCLLIVGYDGIIDRIVRVKAPYEPSAWTPPKDKQAKNDRWADIPIYYAADLDKPVDLAEIGKMIQTRFPNVVTALPPGMPTEAYAARIPGSNVHLGMGMKVPVSGDAFVLANENGMQATGPAADVHAICSLVNNVTGRKALVLGGEKGVYEF